MLLFVALLGCSAGSDDTSDGAGVVMHRVDVEGDLTGVTIPSGSPFAIQLCRETDGGRSCQDRTSSFYTLAGQLCMSGTDDGCGLDTDGGAYAVSWWE